MCCTITVAKEFQRMSLPQALIMVMVCRCAPVAPTHLLSEINGFICIANEHHNYVHIPYHAI